MSNTIIGYTTQGENYSSRTLTGLDLAKQDLHNHFNTRKGERWTNPEFGSMLPYYVFQPLDDATVDLITEDVIDVVSYDPRFELRNNEVRVDNTASTVTVRIELFYVPSATSTDLELQFDREFQEQNEF